MNCEDLAKNWQTQCFSLMLFKAIHALEIEENSDGHVDRVSPRTSKKTRCRVAWVRASDIVSARPLLVIFGVG